MEEGQPPYALRREMQNAEVVIDPGLEMKGHPISLDGAFSMEMSLHRLKVEATGKRSSPHLVDDRIRLDHASWLFVMFLSRLTTTVAQLVETSFLYIASSQP